MVAMAEPLEAPRETHRLSELLNFFPRQQEALQACLAHKYLLYGGAAGGGKSRFLRWLAVVLLIRWAKRGFKGVRVGLFSLDYPTLHDRQLSKIREEFPDWLGTFHEQSREFRLAAAYGGGVICFRNLDKVAKYKSAEFAAILVDELTESEESVFRFLTSRLRWPGIEDPKFVGATNPGSVGHEWCKRLFIDREYPPELEAEAHEFAYVAAKAVDNPHNSKAYHRQLDSLPPDLRAALRDGSWDVFAGQVFSEFRREIHVVQPFEIPSWWSRWACNDPGFTDPGVWYWMAADELGNTYIYRELTASSAQERVQYSDQARKFRQLMTSYELEDAAQKRPIIEQLGYVVTGMDAFNLHPETGKSIVDYYGEGGQYGFRKPVHGPGARKQMAGTMHEYLRVFDGPDGKKTARLKIFSCCKRLIETLPALPADENKPEQVAECAIDHWYQAAGYGLQSRHTNVSTEPVPKKLPEGTIGRLLNWDDADKPKGRSIWSGSQRRKGK